MKTHAFKSVAALVLLTLAASIQVGHAGTAYYLKIDGVPGESTSGGGTNIDVLSWSWGMSSSASATGGGGRAGKVSFQDLNMTKLVDSTSPILFQACASGRHYSELELKGVRGKGTKGEEHITIKMNNVMITSMLLGGMAGEQPPTETLSLNYERVTFTVRRMNPNGSLGAPVTIIWNVEDNTP